MLAAWTILLGVDLWQVALRAPGSLGPSAIAWLAALYLVATGTGALVVGTLGRRAPATMRAVLVATGLALFAIESALRFLPPLSPWRASAVAGAVAAAAAVVPSLRALLRRPAPWLVLVASLLVVAGAVGAMLGFRPARPAPVAETGEAARAGPRDRPSFLVIVVDTLRADHLGCYGYTRPTSPVLDRLATEGVLFERAFAQSSWTKPSTASIFTGRFPMQHQTLYERSKLPDAETTIAELLRPYGYRTAVLSANPWVTPEYGFDQGVDDFVSVYDERFTRVTLFMTVLKRVSQLVDGRMRLYNRVKYLVLGELSTTARDTRLVDEAVRWLDAHRDRPFFLYLHMMSPHHPYDPPPPFDRFVPDRARRPVKNYPRKSYEFFEHGDPLSDADLADMVARYDGDVLYADTEIGRLLAALDRVGLAPTTLVLVTADHGEEFYDHANWGHGQSLYNELIHVPLLLRYPPAVPAGVRAASPVMHAAILPTLLELAGIAPPPVLRLPEAGLLGRLRGRAAASADPTVVSQLIYRSGAADAVIEGDRKLITVHRGSDERSEAYDLTADFAERRPLDGARADVEAMRRRSAEIVGELGRSQNAAEENAGEENRDALKALGYAE